MPGSSVGLDCAASLPSELRAWKQQPDSELAQHSPGRQPAGQSQTSLTHRVLPQHLSDQEEKSPSLVCAGFSILGVEGELLPADQDLQTGLVC